MSGCQQINTILKIKKINLKKKMMHTRRLLDSKDIFTKTSPHNQPFSGGYFYWKIDNKKLNKQK